MGMNIGQRQAYLGCCKWHKSPHKQTLQIDGPAGTGKSYVAVKIIRGLKLEQDEVLCMAFTGRAALNLTRRGLQASSIHASLYDYMEVPKLDEHGEPIYVHGRMLTIKKFVPKSFLSKRVKLLLVDEHYFLNKDIAQVILSYGLPVLLFGDSEQLPPIYGNSYFTEPDYVLDEIVRQSEGSGIIEFATRLRLNKEIPDVKYQFKDDCFILPKRDVTDVILSNSEMILCSTNRTRNYYNKKIRYDINGVKSRLPVPGDKLICRTNSWNRILLGTPLINGTIGSIIRPIDEASIDIKKRQLSIDFRPDYIEHDYYKNLPIDIDYFTSDCGAEEDNMFNRAIKMQLGYAMTVTLSQGSQWESVLFHDDAFGTPDFQRRLRYTAATRASKILVYAI